MIDSRAGDLVHQLAQFYTRQAGALATAEQQHRDDGSGRCTVCRGGGDSSGKSQFPCTTAAAVKVAMTRKARKR